MLFNSYVFLLAFLPLTLLGFFQIGRLWGQFAATLFLTLASLFFYGWWNPDYLWLILFSIIFNFTVGQRVQGHKLYLWGGIAANLSLLGYYKYTNFLVDNLNALAGVDLQVATIVLPIAISFFTFQQIAYLVDIYYGKIKEHSFLNYALFVTFFPQLIAGPIVHHSEMMPQYKRGWHKFNVPLFTQGLTFFCLGLFKKVVIADSLSTYVGPVFSAADAGHYITFFEAWGAAVAYTFQLYFDFSGYTDMALGLGRMFGIKLPHNFKSPYQAVSIIDFWRRWHITLSRFLKDYLYIPLGGNRKGRGRRYLNIFITMVLGGIWHGAGWGFLIWGGLHGFYILVNHAWRDFSTIKMNQHVARLLTFVLVVLAWVFFRAQTLEGAQSITTAMLGGNGLTLPANFGLYLADKAHIFEFIGFTFEGRNLVSTFDWAFGGPALVLLYLVVTLAPNSQTIVNTRWQPTPRWAVAMAMVALVAIGSLPNPSEFLYFDF